MELFKKRPLALSCLISVCLAISSIWLDKNITIAVIVFFAVAIILLFFLLLIGHIKKMRLKYRSILCCLTVFFLIALLLLSSCYFGFSKKIRYTNQFDNELCQVYGKIDEINYRYPYAESYNITVFSIGEDQYKFNAILELDFSSELRRGSVFRLVGEGESLSTQDNMFYLADGLLLKILLTSELAEEIDILHKEDDGKLKSIFNDINRDLQSSILAQTDKKTAALTGAMLLGNRNDLDTVLLRDFRRCGISHTLALSGLHMSIIIGLFDYLLRRLMVRKKLRCVIMSALALVYLAITGFSPSAFRSILMLFFVYMAYMFNCDADNVTSLFIGLVIILTLSPHSITDIGLWMSFIATLGIILVSGLVSKMKFHIKKKSFFKRLLVSVGASFIITITSTISLSVFMWLFFGEISIISPLTNLIFMPHVSAVILLGLLIIIFGWIPGASYVLGLSLSLICNIIREMSAYFSQLRSIVISLRYEFVPFIIVPAIISLLIMIVIKINKKWIFSIPPALAIIAFAMCLNVYNLVNDKEFVHYLKSARSEIIMFQGSSVSVCDISTGGHSHLYAACEVAHEECFVEIENIILTHYHSYHPNTLSRICDKFMVRNIYLPSPAGEDELKILREISNRLSDKKVNTYIYQREDGIQIEEDRFIYVSNSEYIDRSVHPVFALSIVTPNANFMYCTSAFDKAEHMGAQLKLKLADIILWGSHGPKIRGFESLEFFDGFLTDQKAIVFSSPYEMLNNDKMILYLDELSKQGHNIILSEASYYKFCLLE